MRGTRTVLIAAWIGVLVAGATVSASALGTLGGTLAPGESHFVRVVGSDSSGVLAGMATETSQGPLGFQETTETLEEGWVLAHQEGQSLEGPLTVEDERTFTDPNGATWTVYTLDASGQTAWAVEIGQAQHDADLDGEYNFALVVDWDEVPDDADLTTEYRDQLDLVG